MKNFSQRQLVSEQYLQLSRAFMEALESGNDTAQLETIRNEMKKIELQLCQIRDEEALGYDVPHQMLGNNLEKRDSTENNNNAKVA